MKVAVPVPGLVHRRQLPLGVHAEDLDEQLGLGREVAIQGPGGDASALGDRGDRGRGVAALLDRRGRGSEQAVARGEDAQLGHETITSAPREGASVMKRGRMRSAWLCEGRSSTRVATACSTCFISS